MKNEILLSIVISSFAGLIISEQAMAEQLTQTPTKVVYKVEKASGKCASGKCGTEKIYSQTKIDHNPQDKLIMARDGKCGTTGFGLHPTKQEIASKVAGGVCGQ